MLYEVITDKTTVIRAESLVKKPEFTLNTRMEKENAIKILGVITSYSIHYTKLYEHEYLSLSSIQRPLYGL